jgi:hypothetical protein
MGKISQSAGAKVGAVEAAGCGHTERRSAGRSDSRGMMASGQYPSSSRRNRFGVVSGSTGSDRRCVVVVRVVVIV